MMPFAALIDYGMGNLRSVSNALEKAGAELRIVSRPEDAKGAWGVVLPGVGNFGDGMRNLSACGFVDFVHKTVESGKPFLGICLGMQMLLESSEEAPGVRGLGVFKGSVRLFPSGRGEKVPHVGWNQIAHNGTNPFLKGIPSGSHVYFVHSYYAEPEDRSVVAAECDYIFPFAAALGKGNVFASQFHPEKSQKRGMTILENFVQSCKNYGEKQDADHTCH